MKKAIVALVVAVGLLGLPACGGDEEAVPGEGTITTLEGFFEAWSQALCDEMARCGVPGASDNCAGVYRSTLDASERPLVEAEIAAGQVVFDPAGVQACLASVKDPTCSFAFLQFEPLGSAACAAVLAGQVPLGGACRDHLVCAGLPGTFCDISGGCPGLCATRLAQGEHCSYGSVCAADLTCRDGSCEPPDPLPGLGEACASEGGGTTTGGAKQEEGSGGSGSEPACAGFLRCVPDDTAEGGTCRAAEDYAVLEVGDACIPNQALTCAPDLTCVFQIVLNGSTCMAPVAAGEPCWPAYPSMCPEDYTCAVDSHDETGSCQPLPDVGDPCWGDDAVSNTCLSGAHCVDGVCAQPLATGAACTQSAACASSACVDGVCVYRDLCTRDK